MEAVYWSICHPQLREHTNTHSQIQSYNIIINSDKNLYSFVFIYLYLYIYVLLFAFVKICIRHIQIIMQAVAGDHWAGMGVLVFVFVQICTCICICEYLYQKHLNCHAGGVRRPLGRGLCPYICNSI